MKNDSKFTNQKFKLVGTRVTRPDGVDKVTGRARYGADTFAPGQLVGAILRSPHAHAKIRNIDTRRAEKLKGVKAVITSADLPDLTDGDAELWADYATHDGAIGGPYCSTYAVAKRDADADAMVHAELKAGDGAVGGTFYGSLLYTSPSPRD